MNAITPKTVHRRRACQGMMVAFSETDLTEDLEKMDVPTLVIHGDDDQIVPIGASAPHGLCTTHQHVLNEEFLAFLKA